MKKIKDPALYKCIKEFVSFYLPSVMAKSPNTVDSYRITLNLFLSFMIFKGTSITDISSSDFSASRILAFLEWLVTERGNSLGTRDIRLSQIRQFCNYLTKQRLIDMADYSEIQAIKKKNVKGSNDFEYLSIDETACLLSQPNENGRFGMRDKFFMSLLYDSGCRVQEILDLRLKDLVIKPQGAELQIIGKGRKYRVTPVSDKVIQLFYKYCEVFHPALNPDDYLFYIERSGTRNKMSRDNVARFLSNYEQMLRRTDQNLRLDFPHLHPHLFRHTRAMHLYMAGMPLVLISEWLGHSRIETTMIYARATIEMKRAAVEKLDIESPIQEISKQFKYEDDDNIIRQLYGLK